MTDTYYPPASQLGSPRQILGVAAHAGREDIEKAFRWLTSREPPRAGGYAQRLARLEAARDALLAEIRMKAVISRTQENPR